MTRRNIGMIVFLIHFIRNPENSYPSLMGVELREGRWVIIDLCGKGGRLRTVAVPIWVKQAIATWIAAAKIETGRLL